MKVYINRKPRNEPYGGGNAWLTGMFDNVPPDVELLSSPIGADVILIAGLDADGGSPSYEVLSRLVPSHVPMLLRINDCDARKGTNNVDVRWIRAMHGTTKTVYVSSWLREHFLSKHGQTVSSIPNAVIRNGVDRKVWEPFDQSKNVNGPYTVSRVLVHHWSDNPLKGAALYAEVARQCQSAAACNVILHYIGRDPCNLARMRCCRMTQPKHGRELRDVLADPNYGHTVYAGWSTAEPGSNSILEALALGYPTYVGAHGGSCVEFAGSDHVLPNDPAEAAALLINMAKNGTGQRNMNGVPVRDASECAMDFYDLMQDMVRDSSRL